MNAKDEGVPASTLACEVEAYGGGSYSLHRDPDLGLLLSIEQPVGFRARAPATLLGGLAIGGVLLGLHFAVSPFDSLVRYALRVAPCIHFPLGLLLAYAASTRWARIGDGPKVVRLGEATTELDGRVVGRFTRVEQDLAQRRIRLVWEDGDLALTCRTASDVVTLASALELEVAERSDA